MIGYAAYADRFAGDLAGVREHDRLPSRARCHLPAPDAAAAAAGGRQRRRVRGGRLPRRSAPDLGDHRRPARPRRRRCASTASAWCSTSCSTTSPGSTRGRRPRAGAATAATGTYFHVFPDRERARRATSAPCRRSSPTSPPATSARTTTWRAGSGRRSTPGSGTSTGPTPTSSWSTPTSSCSWPTSASRCCRLDAIAFLWKRLGTNCQNQPEVHALTQALRAARADRLPRGGVQGRGHRRARRSRALPRAGPSSRQGQRPRLPQLADGAGLVDARRRRRAAGRRRRCAPCPRRPRRRHGSPTSAATTTSAGPSTTRDAAAVGPHRGTRTARFLSDWYSGEFPGSPARGLVFQYNPATGDRRISGTAASLAGVEAGTRLATGAGAWTPPSTGCCSRTRSSTAGAASRCSGWGRAGPAQRPQLGAGGGARGRQPVGPPATDAGGCRRATT